MMGDWGIRKRSVHPLLTVCDGSKILTEPEPGRIGVILAGTGPEPDRITSLKKLTRFDRIGRIDRIGRTFTGLLKL